MVVGKKRRRSPSELRRDEERRKRHAEKILAGTTDWKPLVPADLSRQLDSEVLFSGADLEKHEASLDRLVEGLRPWLR